MKSEKEIKQEIADTEKQMKELYGKNNNMGKFALLRIKLSTLSWVLRDRKEG